MSFERREYTGGAIITTLATDIGSGDSTLSLSASTGWPTGGTGPFALVIDPGLSNEEKILATARSSNSLSGLSRGYDGTTGAAHSAGAVIKTIGSSIDFDEANQAAHATLGAVTTKGDLTPATGAGATARLAAGSDGLPLVAASGQTTGLQYAALGSTGLASNAVTAAKLASGSVVEASFASTFWHRATFSVTAGASGVSVIPHGASFTPTFYQILFTNPKAAPHTVGGWMEFASPDATNVTVRLTAAADTGGLVASGQTVSGTIISLA